MPKRRPSRRKRTARPPLPQRPGATATPAVTPIGPRAVVVAPPRAAEPPRERERTVTRFTARDYTYVGRELRRIAILAVAIIIAIVVLSFFLP